MSLPGVIGTAQGLLDGKPCIKVLVRQASNDVVGKLPSEIDGYPVEMIVTGDIEAQ